MNFIRVCLWQFLTWSATNTCFNWERCNKHTHMAICHCFFPFHKKYFCKHSWSAQKSHTLFPSSLTVTFFFPNYVLLSMHTKSPGILMTSGIFSSSKSSPPPPPSTQRIGQNWWAPIGTIMKFSIIKNKKHLEGEGMKKYRLVLGQLRTKLKLN